MTNLMIDQWSSQHHHNNFTIYNLRLSPWWQKQNMTKSDTAVILEQSKFGHTYSFLAADIVAAKYFGGGVGLTCETAAFTDIFPYYSNTF